MRKTPSFLNPTVLSKAAALLAVATTAHAASDTWVGSSSTDWNNAANWSPAALPVSGDSFVFGAAGSSGATLTNTLTTGFNVAGITFNSGASAYTMGGNAFTLGGNITNSSTSLETLNQAITLSATRTITTTTGGGDVTLGGNIDGAGGLIKAGSGTLTLSGANTYAGTTTLSGGTLSLGNASNGGLGSGTLILGGGTIQNTSGAGLTISNALSTTGPNVAPVITIAGSQDLTFSGNFQPVGYLNNSFTFTVNNTALTTFNGNIAITAGGDGGQRDLIFNGTGNTLINGIISNGGSSTDNLVKSGTGTLTLSGNNTYTGTTTLSGGTLNLNNAGNGGLGSGALIFIGGTIQNTTGAALTISNLLSTNPAGGISNGVTIAGAQDLTFSNSFTPANYSHLFTFTVNNSGLTTFGTLGSTTMGITSSSGDTAVRDLTFTGTGNTVVNSTIVNGNTQANGIIKSGSGTLTLKGANTYTGATMVNAGTLLVNGSTHASSAVTVASGARLGGTGTVNGTVNVSVSGRIRGGDGSAASGTLTVGNITLGSGSVVELALGAAGAHSTLAFNGTESFQSAQSFNFLDFGATTGTYSGLISGVTTPGSTAGWTISNSGWAGTFTWNSGTNAIDLTLTAVPEPSTYGLIGAGALAGVAFVRRRRRHAGKVAA